MISLHHGIYDNVHLNSADVNCAVIRNMISLIMCRDVNVFIFQKNDRFVMKTTTKIENKTIVFKNDRFFKKFVFQKRSFF